MIRTSANDDCNSLVQVREAIDELDHQLVRLLGQRAQYVRNAARFKKTEDEIAAPERVVAMLALRRQWAESLGVDPDLVEELYRNLIKRFIGAEKREWHSKCSEG